MIRELMLCATTVFMHADAAPTPLEQCADTAVALCGEGNVCCFCVVGEPPSCSFSCRDGEGHCQPCPPCGPRSFIEYEYSTQEIAPGVCWVLGDGELWLVLLDGEPWAVRVR